MASINVLTERQSHMMVVMQKMNATMMRGSKGDKSDPKWEPTLYKDVRDFKIFCKNMSHIATRLKEKFVSTRKNEGTVLKNCFSMLQYVNR